MPNNYIDNILAGAVHVRLGKLFVSLPLPSDTHSLVSLVYFLAIVWLMLPCLLYTGEDTSTFHFSWL